METLAREPEVDDVDRVAGLVRERGVLPGDFLVALGGGAAIDLAKAVAAMATNALSPTVKDYLEGVGRGLELVEDPLPVLAMPTTAGTGCEATKNAVISVVRPAVQEEPSRPPNRAADRAGRPGTLGERAAGDNRRQRHGRDHPTDRELTSPERPGRFPRRCAVQGLRWARSLPAIVEAVASGASRAGPGRRCRTRRCCSRACALANSGLGDGPRRGPGAWEFIAACRTELPAR